ncbi:MAG: 3-dehydroquinate synthase [Flavobacteriales bacterium]|nr:3-dehydroquinate synthase [Flavobacteriales bacterium]
MKVNASTYNVHVGEGVFKALEELLASDKYKNSNIYIIADENSVEHCLPILLDEVESLKEAGVLQIESGEENKNLQTCIDIWGALTDGNVDRKAVVINLGGGVIGDMGGFVASTYKRGIDFINIPTTLLSQVDASIGGKLGIDFERLKNHIGVFNNPQGVFAHAGFLSTLSYEELRSGYAEVIKHGIIADADYWKKVKRTDLESVEDWDDIIFRSIEIKNKIVLEDPTEQGARKSLNFGHTIGHAIESSFLGIEGKHLLHGEAIAIGMICEAFVSYKIADLPLNELDDITDYILALYGKQDIDISDEEGFMNYLKNDKKNQAGETRFTLISRVGNYLVDKQVSQDLIFEALNFYKKER